MGQLSNHPVVLRPEYENDATAQAAKRLLDRCDMHQGGSTYPLNDFVLSLYNGDMWAPNLQALCYRIDREDFENVLTVMRGYAAAGKELHEYFVHGNRLFEGIAERVRVRKTGWFCGDYVLLQLEEYVDAVIERIARYDGKARATEMVLRAKSGGFFNRHDICEESRRRGCVDKDAEAILEQDERDTRLQARARKSILGDDL